jgi:hypothetical protein
MYIETYHTLKNSINNITITTWVPEVLGGINCEHRSVRFSGNFLKISQVVKIRSKNVISFPRVDFIQVAKLILIRFIHKLQEGPAKNTDGSTVIAWICHSKTWGTIWILVRYLAGPSGMS